MSLNLVDRRLTLKFKKQLISTQHEINNHKRIVEKVAKSTLTFIKDTDDASDYEIPKKTNIPL